MHTQRNWWKDLYVEKAPSLHFRKLDVLWFINEVGITWNEEKTFILCSWAWQGIKSMLVIQTKSNSYTTDLHVTVPIGVHD